MYVNSSRPFFLLKFVSNGYGSIFSVLSHHEDLVLILLPVLVRSLFVENLFSDEFWNKSTLNLTLLNSLVVSRPFILFLLFYPLSSNVRTSE